MNKRIISLGSNCYIASYLKEHNLKKESYPFDWIFSYPYDILHMLKDEFKEFLNKENYLIKDELSKFNYHKLYKPNLRMFNHKNPYNIEDHQYYQRCVKRFMNILKEKNEIVFVLGFFNNFIKNEIENIINLNNYLAKITTNQYKIVAFFQKKRGYYDCSQIFKHNNITAIQIMTYDVNNGTDFINQFDKRMFNELFNKFVF